MSFSFGCSFWRRAASRAGWLLLESAFGVALSFTLTVKSASPTFATLALS